MCTCFGPFDKVVTYVKDEGASLNTFIIALTNNFVCFIDVNVAPCMSISCPNVVNMPLMMWKFVVKWEKYFPSKMHRLLFRRLLLGQKKQKVDNNGL
jgi:hypothetical protein